MRQHLGARLCALAVVVLSIAVVAPALAVPTLDTTTQGNWIGVYGASGYILPNYNGPVAGVVGLVANGPNEVVSLPSFVSSYSYTGGNGYVWAAGVNPMADDRPPQNPGSPGGVRNANTAFNGFTVNVTLNKPTEFQLGVYGLDWDSTGRVTNVTVNGDPATFNNTTPVANAYNQGIWGLWDLDLPAGVFQIQVTPVAGNGTISAITFDEILEIPEPASIAVWLLLGAGGVAFAGCRWRK